MCHICFPTLMIQLALTAGLLAASACRNTTITPVPARNDTSNTGHPGAPSPDIITPIPEQTNHFPSPSSGTTPSPSSTPLAPAMGASPVTSRTIHLTQCATLSQSGTHYVLDNDVRADGTCFVIKADNVILDLGGYTVFYDEYAKTGFANAGFEIGTSDIPSSWDLSLAPTAKRISTSILPISGDWFFDWGEAANGSKVISPWTYLPPNQATVLYLLNATLYWDYARIPTFNIRVEFEDGSTVFSQDKPGTDLGATFTSKAIEGRYRATLTLVEGYGLKRGQWARTPSFDEFDLRPQNNYGIEIPGYHRKNIAITNGRIIQGKAKSLRGHAVQVYDAQQIEISNLHIENDGVEASGINTNGSDVIIHDNTVINRNPIKFNRMQLRAAITVMGAPTLPTITRNNMPDCGEGWGCIYVGGKGEISFNNVRSRSVVTNHFAIGGGHLVHHNVVDADPGQGLAPGTEADVYNNSITIKKTAPNAEYGFFETEAIMLKDYNNKTCKNAKIHDNTITIIGDYDPKFETYAASVKPTTLIINGIMNMCSGGGTLIYNNRITAKSVNPRVLVSGIDPGGKFDVDVIIANNIIESEGAGILFGGYGSQGDTISNVSFISNTLIKGPLSSITARTLGIGGHSGNMISDKTHFIDTRFGGGASLKDLAASWMLTVFYVDWYLGLTAQTTEGAPLPGTRVEIQNKAGNVVYEGVTDQNGKIDRVTLTEFKKSGNSMAPVFTYFTPHVVTFTPPGGGPVSQSIEVTSNKDIVFRMGQPVTVLDGAPPNSVLEALPPLRFSQSPAGILDWDTTSTILSLDTDKPATCRYSSSAGTSYDKMTEAFSSSNGTRHSATVANLKSGTNYKYQVKCRDFAGNTNITDIGIDFMVDSTPFLGIPTIRNISPPSGVLMHVKMESAAELQTPAASTQSLPEGTVLVNPARITFEAGIDGNAARFDGPSGFRFAPGNLDLSDTADDGATLEFWLKFNFNPHNYIGNLFFVDSQPFPRPFAVEIYGSTPYLAFEFRHPNGQLAKTGLRFMTYMANWPKWNNWKKSEWHKITLVWKRNSGDTNAEMHLFIDGVQDGCSATVCNDYYGQLPDAGTPVDLMIGGLTSGTSVTIDEIRSFSTSLPMSVLGVPAPPP